MTKHIKQHGFTILELIISLTLIITIAGLIVPKLMKSSGSADIKLAQLQVVKLAGALDMYKLDVGHYPTAEQGLQALVEKPSDARGWNGAYISKKFIKDPWGTQYHYVFPGEHDSFDLSSLGKNKEQGGDGVDQDINSWEDL